MLPCWRAFVLERQRDQVAESAAWHGVLVREEPVVRLHAELVAPGHRLGDQVAAHLAGDAGGDGRREEEPDVGAVARTANARRRLARRRRGRSRRRRATSSIHDRLSKSAARNQQVSSRSSGYTPMTCRPCR